MRHLLAIFFLLLCPVLASSESIEGFSYGGSADEVIARIGEPSAVTGPEYQKSSRSWVWGWEYSRYGALFEVEADTQDGVKRIRSLTIVSPCPWKTTSGLGIGDTTQRLLQIYPDIRRYQDSLWFALAPDKRHVAGFELTGSRIKSIFIGSRRR